MATNTTTEDGCVCTKQKTHRPNNLQKSTVASLVCQRTSFFLSFFHFVINNNTNRTKEKEWAKIQAKIPKKRKKKKTQTRKKEQNTIFTLLCERRVHKIIYSKFTHIWKRLETNCSFHCVRVSFARSLSPFMCMCALDWHNIRDTMF